ncbi:hypothetical protein QWJ07_08965 [Frankia sp. RB7]|nr:hypothetical protein [Frankia sp. RB7]
MLAEGLSQADIEAVKDHLTMLRANDMVLTKHYVLRQMIESVQAVPTAMRSASLSKMPPTIFGTRRRSGKPRAFQTCSSSSSFRTDAFMI